MRGFNCTPAATLARNGNNIVAYDSDLLSSGSETY